MYSLHLTHPKWTHTRSSGQPCYSARGAVGGSVPCSRTPQSWYWRRILPPPTIPAGPEIRTHNLPLTSPTRYPLGHDCPYCAVCVSSATAFCLFPDAKRLHPRQAHWALFFTWFSFTITYRPGNQNPKADALSRLHAPDQPSEPEPILPPALIVSPIRWDLTERIRDTTRTEPALQGGPEGKTYMPSSQRLNHSGLSSWSTGLWTPRQPANSLAPTSSVLVAQYGPGCHQVRPQLLSLWPCQRPPAIFRLASWFPCLFPKGPGRTSG